MQKQVHVVLGEGELFQIVDGLELRAEAWRKTATYLDTGDSGDNFFMIEECRDADEARSIAEAYAGIIGKLRKQQAAQAGQTSLDFKEPGKEGVVSAYAIYVDTLCSGPVAVGRNENKLTVAYTTERAARC